MPIIHTDNIEKVEIKIPISPVEYKFNIFEKGKFGVRSIISEDKDSIRIIFDDTESIKYYKTEMVIYFAPYKKN